MEDQPGVYLIRCLPTGECYVGGTRNSFAQRFSEHRNQLRRRACSIPKLQVAYDQHGEAAFEYIPLKAFPPEQVSEREKEAIAALRPAFNTCHMTPKGRYARWDKIMVAGEETTVSAAARKFGLDPNTIRLRIKRGLTGDALVAPSHRAPRKPYIRRQ